ncbi:MAG: hypothetical protein IT449_16930 [Phycisphaerales bacterium]|nr:hypothetical protein [Phycisphaerales bacterium]
MKVFLIQHSHSDPGYTHPRDEVGRHQIRNIERSVGFARRDPEYRWNVECFWMIDEALRRGSPLPDGFLELARQGRIALTATFLNGSDHLDAEDFRRMLRYARAFCDAHGIPLRSAMQCDVNGVNACMPDLLCEVGVKRMAFAINDERGGTPFARPNAFSWRGPGGGRILVFNGYEYLRANVYGMHRGFEAFCGGAQKLVDDLRRTNYALPVCLLQGCGTFDDNGLAAPWMAEMSRAWRENSARRGATAAGSGGARTGAPRLQDGEPLTVESLEFVSASIDEFFDALEQCGAPFPEHTGPWPDWWSDGQTSAPLELRRAYEARRTLRAIEPLIPATAKHDGTTFDAVQRDVWMYLEHTFGSWRCVGEPEAPDSKRQWADKSLIAHRAAEEVGFLTEDVLCDLAKGDGCILFPPQCTTAQYVVTQVPREDFPESGEVLFQPNAAAARAWVVVPKEPQAMASLITWARPAGDPLVALRRSGFQPMTFEAHCNASANAAARATNFPLVVVETLGGTRQQLRHGDSSIRRDRVEARIGAIEHRECELWSAARCSLEAPGWRGLSVTRRTWRDGRMHEFLLSGVKEYVEAPNACFLVWRPQAKPDEVWAESGGFWHRPGLDELPGACRDWHVVQQGVEMRWRDGTSLAFHSPDAPVIHFGGINTGKWGRGLDPTNGELAVCLYHNYWYVNFPPAAPGRLRFRFRICAAPQMDARSLLSSWNSPFLVHLDSPRARQLRERRLSRLSSQAIR